MPELAIPQPFCVSKRRSELRQSRGRQSARAIAKLLVPLLDSSQVPEVALH